MHTKIRNCTCGRKAEIVNLDGLEYFIACTRTNRPFLDNICWMGPVKSSETQAIEVWNWAMKTLDHVKGKPKRV
jgi:hypothetical protein